jgi:hypothetical protein
MTENSFLPLRRAVLGAMFASVALPRPSFAQQRSVPTGQEPTDMRIRLAFNGKSMTATLYDNPSARDLASLLPLDLTIDDHGNNEKIAYLPRKLTEDGSGPFDNERPGDLCYFRSWGNLAMFYADYRWEGLIRLGHFEGSFEPLLVRGKFPLRIERIP